jgi:hypothetical protein
MLSSRICDKVHFKCGIYTKILYETFLYLFLICKTITLIENRKAVIPSSGVRPLCLLMQMQWLPLHILAAWRPSIISSLGVLRWWVVSPPPNPLARGPPSVGSPRLLVRYIRSYPPYLEAVSSICNLRTRHAVMTRVPLKVGSFLYGCPKEASCTPTQTFAVAQLLYFTLTSFHNTVFDKRM